jgi:hypothetical protein
VVLALSPLVHHEEFSMLQRKPELLNGHVWHSEIQIANPKTNVAKSTYRLGKAYLLVGRMDEVKMVVLRRMVQVCEEV